MILRVVCALLFVLSAGEARAEINVADSLEWQVAEADVVVRGTVEGASARKGPGDVTFYDATFRVAETLKGAPSKKARVRVRHLWGPTPAEWKDEGVELLLFLDGKGAMQGWIRLTGEKVGPAYDMQFGVLDERGEILRATRKAAAVKGAKGKHTVDVPFGTPAFRALWGGSAVWLIVPVDGRLETIARGWAGSPDLTRRVEAVKALSHFGSRANTALLRRMLRDSGHVTVTRGDGSPGLRRYPVRARAYDTLRQWGVKVARPLIEESIP